MRLSSILPLSFRPSLPIAAVLCILGTALQAFAADFTWPANTVQCGIVSMNITGGSPPYEFTIVPVDGQVFSWNLIEPVSGKWINETWDVQLQMPAGTAYVAYLSHSGSFGQGGITPIQVVGSSTDTLCLSTASSNASTNLFSMDLHGLPAPTECDTSLRIGHDGSAASAPYNYTIVPLDGGYKPWSGSFPEGKSVVDVGVNMTRGSRFSVFLSSRIGYGGAQTSKIYTVNATRSNTITCETQPYAPPVGYVWPSSLLSSTLPIADDYNASSSVSPVTSTGSSPIGPSSSSSSAAPGSTGDSSGAKGLSTGAMAGIGAGVGCLALAGLGLLVWWYLRKRRARGTTGQRGYAYESGEKRFDMLSPPKHKHADSYGPDKASGGESGGDGADEPRVEPFRTHSDHARASLPVQGYAYDGGSGNGSGSGSGSGQVLLVPGPGSPPLHLHSPGPSSDSGQTGQTDYAYANASVDPLLQNQQQHGGTMFPTPRPSGDPSRALSDSDGLSRGPTGTAFYYIPPSGSMGMTSGSAIDVGRVGSAGGSQSGRGGDQGQGQGQGPMPPGTMIRGPVSAAAEKARLSAQYAQMDAVPNSATDNHDSNNSITSPASSSSPLTPPGPNAMPMPMSMDTFSQSHLPQRADSPAQAAQTRVSVHSPATVVESQYGHVQATPGHGEGNQEGQRRGQEEQGEGGGGGGGGATYRRHMDGGALQDENRPDVGEVELPPLYEDVPGRRT